MVYIYTCQACERDDHIHCELGHPCAPGKYGGSKCRCPCLGDPHWNDPNNVKLVFEKMENFLKRFDKAMAKIIKFDNDNDT